MTTIAPRVPARRPQPGVFDFRKPGFFRLALVSSAILLLFSWSIVALSHLPGHNSLCCAAASQEGARDATPSHLNPAEGPPVYTYKVISSHPHDTGAFTQGLVFSEGFFYEGTGGYGKSTIRKVNPNTGVVLQHRKISDQHFGEGITLFGNDLIQLTWRSHQGFVYDKETFALKRVFSYPTEGWGITTDGMRLIMSDGTSTLYFLDPTTFAVTGNLTVSDNNGPVSMLNELEYVQGELYANVWGTERIAMISPFTGKVVGWLNLKGLWNASEQDPTVDVLNGIAFDARGKRLFVTGKLWPKIFQIELIPPSDNTLPTSLPRGEKAAGGNR
jgi:glutaminyl-peptide cyclotransferase